jgi:hypothetical protein
MNPDYVATPDLRILSVLAGLAGHHGKLWCFPSQEKILELLRRRYHRIISRRTLNRHLGALQAQHLIRRHRRHKTGATGALELHSTVYVILNGATRILKGIASYLSTAAAHPWARNAFYAVTKPAQSAALQANIMTPAGKTDPPPPANQSSALRALLQTTLKRIPGC